LPGKNKGAASNGAGLNSTNQYYETAISYWHLATGLILTGIKILVFDL